MWLYRQVYRSQEGFEQMKMNRKIFLAGAAALFLLGQVTAGFAAPQAAGGQTDREMQHKVCLMWQQPKPEEKKLTFPGRPAGRFPCSPRSPAALLSL